jgi:hypothetical protein
LAVNGGGGAQPLSIAAWGHEVQSVWARPRGRLVALSPRP